MYVSSMYVATYRMIRSEKERCFLGHGKCSARLHALWLKAAWKSRGNPTCTHRLFSWLPSPRTTGRCCTSVVSYAARTKTVIGSSGPQLDRPHELQFRACPVHGRSIFQSTWSAKLAACLDWIGWFHAWFLLLFLQFEGTVKVL